MNDVHTTAGKNAPEMMTGTFSVGGNRLAEAPMHEKALTVARERLGMLIERTMEVAGRLEAIGDRAFGSFPQNDAKSTCSPVRSGDLGAINDGLDALGSQIARAHDAMTRLESL